jgi:hypothetical protein
MKFNIAIPSIHVPHLRPIHVDHWNPKVRVPFLSLLFEPRALWKWFFMWGFCLYIAFCLFCFFHWELPRLNHETFIRFGADSPTYWEAIKYRQDHADHPNVLLSFTGNLLGPVLIGTILGTGLNVTLFNIAIFFIAVEVACTIPGVNRYRMLFLLAISAETAAGISTLNKEILVLLSTVMLAKYIYSEKKSMLLMGLILFISLFARWEQIALILLFLFFQRRKSVFKRNPWVAIGAVVGVLSVLYALIARIPGSGIRAFTQYAEGANTIAKLNKIQTLGGYPLVVVPKIIMDLFGELLRPFTLIREYNYAGLNVGDIHSGVIIPLFSIVLLTILWLSYRRGFLNPRRPIGFLIIIYLVTTAVTPFVQPRYNYFVYVLLCVELSRITNEAEARPLFPRTYRFPSLGGPRLVLRTKRHSA